MDYLILSVMAAAYFVPFVWSIYIGVKRNVDILYISCWMPVLNIGMLASYYECAKKDKISEEKKRQAEEEIKTREDFYRLHITLIDGSDFVTKSFGPYYNEYRECIVGGKSNIQDQIKGIISREYITMGDVKYPYHSMKSIEVVEASDGKI